MAENLANLLSLPDGWSWLAYLAVAVLHVGVLMAIVVPAAAVFTWLERKAAGRMADRLGPTRVGGRFGWLQAPADGLKLLSKEDLIPGGADAMLFRIAPYISFCASFTLFLAIPFANGWVAQHMNVAVFFILAVAGLEVFGVVLAGYSSNSKWSLYGAMRAGAQVVSCEVPLAMCVVIPVMIAGTMDLTAIGQMQRGFFWNWFLFHDPFTFLVFFVYCTCAVATVNRAPFDLAEAESELVAGFLTEYSGFRWSVFFMAEYGSMLALSALGSILWLGGWNGPIPITAIFPDHWLAVEFGAAIGAFNMLLKSCLGVTAMIWLRWSLPRLRVDQVMTTCLKYCLPLASAAFLGAMLWTVLLPGGLIPVGTPLGETPEGSRIVFEADATDNADSEEGEQT